MSSDELTWSEEVHKRLVMWGAWIAGPQVYRNPMNPIAAMVRRAAGELPGDDISIPHDLTFELHVVEKSLGLMKQSEFSRDRQARRLILLVYRDAVEPIDLEVKMGWTPERRKIEVWRAESILSRYMIRMEQDPALLAQYGRHK